MSRFIKLKVVSVSEAGLESHVSRFGYKKSDAIVIPNFFEVSKEFKQKISSSIKLRSKRRAGLVVAFVGRYDPLKNVAGFFEMAGHIEKTNPRLVSEYLVVGPGMSKDNVELRSLFKGNACHSKVMLLDENHV